MQHIIAVGMIPGTCPHATTTAYTNPATCYPNSITTDLQSTDGDDQVTINPTTGTKIFMSTLS